MIKFILWKNLYCHKSYKSGVLPLEKILVSIYFKEMFFISRESSVSKLCGIQGDSSSLLIRFPFTFFTFSREKKCLKDRSENSPKMTRGKWEGGREWFSTDPNLRAKGKKQWNGTAPSLSSELKIHWVALESHKWAF